MSQTLSRKDPIARTLISHPDQPVHLIIDLERLDRDLVYATAMRNTVMAIIATRCPATMEMAYPLGKIRQVPTGLAS